MESSILAGQLARILLEPPDGLATADTGVAHPSLPDYMALTAGGTFFMDNCVGCVTPAVNSADLIEASGRTWTAYMEDMAEPCVGGDFGL